jgi:hypothetical protein
MKKKAKQSQEKRSVTKRSEIDILDNRSPDIIKRGIRKGDENMTMVQGYHAKVPLFQG